MRKVVLLLFFSLLSGLMYAQEERALCLSMRDGSSVSFFLNERPKMTFVADSVKIVSSASQTKVKRSDVLDIKFRMDVPSGIEDVCENGTVEIGSEFIRVENMRPDGVVNVYSVDGRVVVSGKADSNGSVVIGLHSIPSGIYLLNYNDITIKFIRR
jgi:hypothetical protein